MDWLIVIFAGIPCLLVAVFYIVAVVWSVIIWLHSRWGFFDDGNLWRGEEEDHEN